jgi:Raf kinase inhibitor-like YbhB/YbcL family protein
MTFQLTSSAFGDGEPIPVRYSADGENLSPPLQWSDPPEGTRTFSLIVEDPDAPMTTWVHWVLFNLPADLRELPAGAGNGSSPPPGAQAGRNSRRRHTYDGPSPPWGTHRYYFRLSALDVELSLPDGPTKANVLQNIEGHVLAEAVLMGTYSRPSLLQRIKGKLGL